MLKLGVMDVVAIAIEDQRLILGRKIIFLVELTIYEVSEILHFTLTEERLAVNIALLFKFVYDHRLSL